MLCLHKCIDHSTTMERTTGSHSHLNNSEKTGLSLEDILLALHKNTFCILAACRENKDVYTLSWALTNVIYLFPYKPVRGLNLSLQILKVKPYRETGHWIIYWQWFISFIHTHTFEHDGYIYTTKIYTFKRNGWRVKRNQSFA